MTARFCYIGDTMRARRGAVDSAIARIRSGRSKFGERYTGYNCVSSIILSGESEYKRITFLQLDKACPLQECLHVDKIVLYMNRLYYGIKTRKLCELKFTVHSLFIITE